jgi:phage terminase large subunit-like protein
VPFDVALADKVCNFAETLKFVKGEHGGQHVRLMKWQEDVLSDIFGNVDDDGQRIIRTALLEIPKKCGKSFLAAVIALYVLDQDGEPGCEVYSAASSRDQASLVFRDAAAMVRSSRYLSRKWRIIDSTRTIISRTDPTCFYRAVAADSSGVDGVNPHLVVFDELHRFKTAKALDLWAILRKGQIARRQPLSVAITTAGVEDESPLCWQEHEYVRRVNEGILPPNPRYYGRIWGASESDDPGSPETWRKAIPSLETNGGFLKEEAIRDIYEEARSKGEQELADFKRYHLNIWGQKGKRYISPHIWARGAQPRRAVVERTCYAGLDLSERIDLSSLVLLFPEADLVAQEDGEIVSRVSFDVLPFFWMPEEAVLKRERLDGVPYRDWIKAGYIETCDGDAIDYELIKRRIRWAHEFFELREVAFDRAMATQLSIAMDSEGITMVPVHQNYMTLSEPTKQVKELSLLGLFRHEDNPVLKWNIDCMSVKSDGHDLIKPIKPNRATENKRIDGAAALIMALQRYLLQPMDGPSPWANVETAVM